MSRELLKRALYKLTELSNYDNNCFGVELLIEEIERFLVKPLPDPVSMANTRPTAPGWYWYELPGSWALQPALVFDAGDGLGLFYTLDPIASDVKDAERDGFSMDKCSENARWSSERIVSVNAEPPVIVDKGHWTVSGDGSQLYSDDFTHDVALQILGDFEDDSQRKEYANGLVKKLNGVPSARTPLSKAEIEEFCFLMPDPLKDKFKRGVRFAEDKINGIKEQ
jgi:hypothetical protein